MAQFTKNNKRNPLERHSSQGLVLGCPICAAKLDLLDTRDGDQAYWCHRCQSGWRVGNLPEAAHRSKDSAAPAPPVEAPQQRKEALPPPSPRANKPRISARAAVPSAKAPVAQPPALSPRAANRQPRASAVLPAAAVTAPKRRAEPQEIVAPKRKPSPRAPEVAVRTLNTRASKIEPSEQSALESKGSRKAARVESPFPKRGKRSAPESVAATRAPNSSLKLALETRGRATRQPVKVLAPPLKPRRATRQPLETVPPAPQPKRASLEVAAPIKSPTPRVKRSAPALAVSGKGSRRPAAPVPKAAVGKRRPLEVAVKPKISAPRATAHEPRRKTLETATGKRLPLETVSAPKTSAARAAPSKPSKKAQQPRPILEPMTPKPRRTSARVAAQPGALKPARVAAQKRDVKTGPVVQPRAAQPNAPLEPISKPTRAAREAAQPSPAKPTRAPRVAQPPALLAPVRSKSARSSPARPAPAQPAQFGLFDALPPKTAARKPR